jgi:hypothetical protein
MSDKLIANQAALIRELVELLELLSWADCYCASNHKPECLVGKANALLARLEAAVIEEKP